MKKYCFIGLFVLFIGIITFLFICKNNKITYSSVSILAINQMETEKKIVDIAPDYSYKVNIHYPYTGYNNLNKEVEKLIKKYLTDFMKADKPFLDNQVYSLDITYDTYKYQNIVSYVFTIFIDTGGAHPNTIIETISYNTKDNILITIDSLIEENNNILDKLSKESRLILAKNSNLKQENIQDMILDGTLPKKENFSNFAFTDKGLLVFFNRYQIAPYSFGSFNITIPYSDLDILKR